MDAITLIGLALALAMDAFAVALSTGVILKKLTGRHLFRLGFHFGLFQALMQAIDMPERWRTQLIHDFWRRDALQQRLREAGLEALRAGPITRFEAEGHRLTLFPDGRTLVEGTEDTGRARALVARWIGA